ncbi:PAS domain S-box protein [Chitinophaga pendula]|uniref:PAS domain S-box protein n=1 Tax=Chitinophaga TaxID=79328 RepID=UPI000BAEE8DF|nr:MULTISPECIES: PAS domain S-box protein [Chitinophaga]ASZ10219.1 hypothetical protein CK934_04105 [Chitinophaga sp. MD30]UCJ06822.1 PAS domain S-box protein [Chitinophaga pendula]
MRQLKKPILIFMCIGLVGLACFIYFVIRTHQQATDAGKWVRHTHQVIDNIHLATLAIAENESTVSQYLASGPGTTASSIACSYPADVAKAVSKLIQLTSDNPRQQALIRQFSHAVRQQVATNCLRAKAITIPPALHQQDLRYIDTIRQTAHAMLQEESQLLATRTRDSSIAALRSLIISLLGGAFSTCFFLAGAYRINRHMHEKEKAEKNMRENEARYRQLIEDTNAVLYTTNRGGYFTYVSKQVGLLTGYPEGALVGAHYSILLGEETHQQLREFYETHLGNNGPIPTREFEIITRSGDRKWVEQEVVVLRKDGLVKGYQCMVKDITERKKMSAELENTRLRLQAIMDYSPSLIWVKDLLGRYLLVNRQVEEVFNLPADYITGQTDQQLQLPHITPACAAEDAAVLSTGAIRSGVMTVPGRDQQDHYYHITRFPLRDEQQQLFGLCAIGIDITDRARKEMELIQARKDAENAKKIQEMFLANMSHEIRTPMNGILGMTNLLLTTPLPPQQQEFIEAISTSANSLLVIINEILDLSCIRSGKLKLENSDFDLMTLLEVLLYPLRHKAVQKGLFFQVAVESDVPTLLVGDHVRLGQILVNLVGNAIKFTHQGGIHVIVSLLTTAEETVRLQFEIKDTGIGIPEEHHNMIFDSFSQSNLENTRQYDGAGLGLAISKELVTLQQGSIRVISAAGEGATFVVELPYLRSSVSRQEKQTASPSATAQRHILKGKTILLVEDNKINQQVAFHTLLRAGAQVDIVPNGAAAISFILKRHYDCVIMDLQMPEMDGYQAVTILRKQAINIPVIAMTAAATTREKIKCLAAGMNDYISKPFVPEDLYHKILDCTGSSSFIHHIPHTRNTNTCYDPVDFEHIYKVVENDIPYVLEILEEFNEQLPETIAALEEGAIQQDWDSIYHLTHRMKSSMAVVRIPPALPLIDSIEMDTSARQRLDTAATRVFELIQTLKDAALLISMEIDKIQAAIQSEETTIDQATGNRK